MSQCLTGSLHFLCSNLHIITVSNMHTYTHIIFFCKATLSLFVVEFCDSLFSFPFLFHRHGWGTRLDVHDPFLALAAEHRLLQAEYEDYAAANNGHIACCRAVALIVCYSITLLIVSVCLFRFHCYQKFERIY